MYVPREDFGNLLFLGGQVRFTNVWGGDARIFAIPAQVDAALTKLCDVLGELGARFDDVVLLWNRVADLDADEDAVLMTRSRRGLRRPLAEAVLELAASDPNGAAPDGTPVALEYICVAQMPPQRA